MTQASHSHRAWLLLVPVGLTVALAAGDLRSVTAQQAVPPPPPPAVTAEPVPGPGHDVFVKTCSGCHAPTVATVQRRSEDDWINIVTAMRARGANGSDDDFIAIVEYLAKNYGPTKAP